MGYLFQALPADLLTAELPQLSGIEPGTDRERHLTTVFLSTVLAVPEFRVRVLQLLGARGGAGKAEVFGQVRFCGETENAAKSSAPLAGLIRVRGAGSFSALVDARQHTFESSNTAHVRQMARDLTTARERKIQRVAALASTVPDQAFLEAVRAQPSSPPIDRLRSLTWMETVDIAFHLLDRKIVRGAVGVYLLEQYVRFIKSEAVRDVQARAERPEGAIYFASLGGDWGRLVYDIRQGPVDSRDPRLAAAATNWLSFLRFIALYLTRGAQRDEDILSFPNLRGPSLTARKDVVMRRLNADGKLLATFKRQDEAVATVLGVDIKDPLITMQIEVDGPPDKGPPDNRIRELAESVRDDRTTGTTLVKVFWPSEKVPRIVTREQALKDPIATAPPSHDMLPERFIVERTVPCETLIGDPESFVQLVMLELRGFRASVRHILRSGLPHA